MRKNINNRLSISKASLVCLISIFSLILVLNLLTPLVADDFAYASAHSLSEVFALEKIQYLTWGGRSVAHIFARTFLMLPKLIFSLLNSVVFVSLVMILNFFVIGKLDLSNHRPLVWISGLILLCAPWFGQTCLWLTGSCNYLWMATIIFAFLLPYRLNYDHKIKFNYVYLVIFGIAAGWSNENAGGAALLFILLMALIELVFNHKKDYLPYGIGFIACLFGFLMMILAPGNYIRAAQLPPLEGIYQYVHQANQLLEVLFTSDKGMFVLILIALVSFGLMIGTKQSKHILPMVAIPLICGIACSCAMILTPVTIYYDRSQFAASLWVIIAGVTGFNAFVTQLKTKYLTNGTTALIIGLSIGAYAFALLDNGYFFIQALDRSNMIKKQINAGSSNVVVSEYNSEFMSFYNPMKQLVDVDSNAYSKINQEVASYYGIDSISLTPTFFFDTVYRYGDYALMNIMDFHQYMHYLQSHDNYSYLLITTRCDDSCDALISSIDPSSEVGDYHTIILNDGNYMHKVSDEGIELFTYLFDKQVYLSSYEDANIADIVLEEDEYTFNNPGITIVTFDNNLYKVVDVVNFNHTNGYTYTYRGVLNQ